jgi:AcrR family transcriptional regulator
MKEDNSSYKLIIDTSRKVFGKYGFRKASLDDIAKEAGLSKTAVYYYFKNKEDVFQEVVKTEAEILKTNILSSVSNFSDPKGKLKAYITSRMNTLRNVSIIYDVFKTELFDHLPFIDQLREEYQKEEVFLVQQILEEGNLKETFDVPNTGLTAETIVTLLKGLEIPLFINASPDQLESKLNNFIHLIINGLTKPKNQ